MESGDKQPKTLTVSLAEWANLLDPLEAADLLDLKDSLFGSDLDSDGKDEDEMDSKQSGKHLSDPSVKRKHTDSGGSKPSSPGVKIVGKRYDFALYYNIF